MQSGRIWFGGKKTARGQVSLSQDLADPEARTGRDIVALPGDGPLLERRRIDGMRVALVLGPGVGPNFEASGEAGNKTDRFPHLGLINLASFLRRAGATVSIHDLFVNGSFSKEEMLELQDPTRIHNALRGSTDPALQAIIDKWARALAQERCDIFGFSSAIETDPVSVVAVVRRMRELGVKTPVALGGYWKTKELTPDLSREIDFLVNAEGEAPMLLLCHAVANGTPTDRIPGVGHFDPVTGEGNFSAVDHSLDILAPPDLEGFPLGSYSNDLYTGWQGTTIPYRFSVGCPNDCAYCNEPNKRRFKMRHFDLVARDLEKLYHDYGVEQFFFLNTAFSIVPKYADALLDRMVASGNRWRWSDCERPRKADPERFRKMRQAGCDWLNWGVDTPSDRLAQLYNRRMTFEHLEKVFRAADNAGIKNSVNLILGMPHETDDDVEQFFRFLERNRNVIHWIFLFEYDFIPHSTIGKEPGRFDLITTADGGGVDEVGGRSWNEQRVRIRATIEQHRQRIFDLIGSTTPRFKQGDGKPHKKKVFDGTQPGGPGSLLRRLFGL